MKEHLNFAVGAITAVISLWGMGELAFRAGLSVIIGTSTAMALMALWDVWRERRSAKQ